MLKARTAKKKAATTATNEANHKKSVKLNTLQKRKVKKWPFIVENFVQKQVPA